jgi:hypothetical protein
MLKLTVLDMQKLHVKALKISKMGIYLLLNLGVGNRGAQFIAQNVKNLKRLWISKQCSNSDDNSIGDLGAIAIANSLEKLILLNISRRWNDSGRNNIGD